MDCDLDYSGISICSVSGTNFKPYAKFLAGLRIPFSIVTDWDPKESGAPLGAKRARDLIRTIEEVRNGAVSEDLETTLNDADYDALCEKAEEYGLFFNGHTLEVDLFQDGYEQYIAEELLDSGFGPRRTATINGWLENSEDLNIPRYLGIIEEIGKGRFAQRLATRLEGVAPPDYIESAISYVAERV